MAPGTHGRDLNPDVETWRRYLEATRARGPRPDVLRALEYVADPGPALELGCGAGADTLELLRRGFDVLAVDALAEAVEATRRRADEAGFGAGLETRRAPFETLELPRATYVLVAASFSLPFCEAARFDELWRRIEGSLAPGGVFVGQLFGDRDEWARDDASPGNVFLPREEVERRAAGFDVLRLDEVEERRETALGEEKDWHLFHFILRAPVRA